MVVGHHHHYSSHCPYNYSCCLWWTNHHQSYCLKIQMNCMNHLTCQSHHLLCLQVHPGSCPPYQLEKVTVPGIFWVCPMAITQSIASQGIRSSVHLCCATQAPEVSDITQRPPWALPGGPRQTASMVHGIILLVCSSWH